MKTLRNMAIALAVGGGLFIALALAETTTPGLDFGPVKWSLPLVLSSGLFAGLNGLAGNRRARVANDTRKAELLAFARTPGRGWIVVMRDKSNSAPSNGFDVSIDGSVIAQLLPKRFTLMALPEGTHHLFADFARAPGASAVAPLEVDVLAGSVLIFAIRSSMGLVRSSLRLEPVADTPAVRATLTRMKLVEAEESS